MGKYRIGISYDEEERAKKLKEEEVREHAGILYSLYEDTDDDGFQNALKEEIEAIRKAISPDVNERKNVYLENHKKGGKNGEELATFITDFFDTQNDYEQNYKARYNEYLSRKNAIEKDGENKKDELEKKKNDLLSQLRDKLKKAEDELDAAKKANDESKVKKLEETITGLKGSPSFVNTTYAENIDKINEEVNSRLKELENNDDIKKAIEAYDSYTEKNKKFRHIQDLVKLHPDVLESVAGLSEHGADVIEQALKEILTSYHDFPTKTVEKDGEKVVENKHTVTYDKENKSLSHNIFNLNGTGLDLRFINSKTPFFYWKDKLTQEQLEALVAFCRANGIDISDFGPAKDEPVVDKDGNEVGTFESEYNRLMGNEPKEEANEQEQSTIPSEGHLTESEEVRSGSFFGSFIPKEKIKYGTLDIDKAIGSIRKFVNPNAEIVEDSFFGKTTLSVYDDVRAKEKDGIVGKDGHREHTKKFSVTFHRGNPIRSSIYLGKEKMSTDLARVILDVYKAQGLKYFTFPPLTASNGFGKEGQVAFLKASVKTGMVILLKGEKGKGCSIGPADLNTILEETKKEENFIRNHDQKIEYLMRWHEQLEKFVKYNPKEEQQLRDYLGKFKQQANFEYFTSSYKDLLDDEIEKGLNGEYDNKKWDEVDVIASKYALNKIVEEMKEGKIDGVRFNPLKKDDNAKKIVEAFHKHIKEHRKTIEEEIKDKVNSETDNARDNGKEIDINTRNRIQNNAIKTIRDQYQTNLSRTCDELSGDGVDIKFKSHGHGETYVFKNNNNHTDRGASKPVTPTPRKVQRM